MWFNAFLHIYVPMESTTRYKLEHAPTPGGSLLWPLLSSPLPRAHPSLMVRAYESEYNASISISSKMYSLECASIHGSPLGFFPEVTCIKGTVSSQVTNLWAFAISNGILYTTSELFCGWIILCISVFSRRTPVFTETSPYWIDPTLLFFGFCLNDRYVFAECMNDTSMCFLACPQLQKFL